MPPRQAIQQPCGCIDEVWGWKQPPFQGQDIYTTLCGQHLATLNNGGQQQRPNMTQPQVQIPTTIGGTQSNPFFQFQMGGFGHHFQMPQQGGQQ